MLGTELNADMFVFMGTWLFKYAKLTDRQDACRKMFPPAVFKNDNAVNIMAKHTDIIMDILAVSESDKELFIKALQEHIDKNPKSPLNPLAIELKLNWGLDVK